MGPKKRASLTTHDIAYAGAAVALLAVSAWVTVPVGPVPFTLQTMAVTFVALSMTPRRAMTSICCYVLVGAVGVPVFSGFRGGVGVIAGPTGGFVIGFVFGVAAAGAILAWRRTRLTEGLAAFVAVAVSYLLGWAWLMVSAHLGAVAALMAGCVPFVIPDVVKVFVGVEVARAVRSAVPSLAQEG